MKKNALLAFIILLAILLTSSPFIFGLIDTPKDQSYLGTHFMNSADTFAYYGLYTQTKHGHLLFFNPYTPEKHSPLFFRPSFTIAAIIMKTFSLSSIQIYHLFRILYGILFLIVLFGFLNSFFPVRPIKYYVFSILIFGSGLGWLAIRFISDPLDLWIPETNIFQSLMEAPHFTFALSLILIIFWLWKKNMPELSLNLTLLASLIAILLFFCHPFDAPIIYTTIFLYFIFLSYLDKKQNFKPALMLFALFVLISFMPIIWQSYLIKTNMILNYWSKQNTNLSPSIAGALGGLGIWLPLGILGIIYSLKNKDKNFILISSWTISYYILIYLPINIQRRFLEGLFIPHIMLSCYFIFNIRLKNYFINKKYLLLTGTVLALFLFLNSFSNILLLKRDYIKLSANKHLPFYAYKNTINGLNWLEKHNPSLKTILANWDISYLLPTYVYAQTFWGHRVQTINPQQKEIEINNYFNNKLSNNKKKNFYKKYNPNYLIWEKDDNSKPYKPDNDIYLNKIYHNCDITIYNIAN